MTFFALMRFFHCLLLSVLFVVLQNSFYVKTFIYQTNKNHYWNGNSYVRILIEIHSNIYNSHSYGCRNGSSLASEGTVHQGDTHDNSQPTRLRKNLALLHSLTVTMVLLSQMRNIFMIVQIVTSFDGLNDFLAEMFSYHHASCFYDIQAFV